MFTEFLSFLQVDCLNSSETILVSVFFFFFWLQIKSNNCSYFWSGVVAFMYSYSSCTSILLLMRKAHNASTLVCFFVLFLPCVFFLLAKKWRNEQRGKGRHAGRGRGCHDKTQRTHAGCRCRCMPTPPFPESLLWLIDLPPPLPPFNQFLNEISESNACRGQNEIVIILIANYKKKYRQLCPLLQGLFSIFMILY